jgi:hypothetical protein
VAVGGGGFTSDDVGLGHGRKEEEREEEEERGPRYGCSGSVAAPGGVAR